MSYTNYKNDFKELELRARAIDNAVNVLAQSIGIFICEIVKNDGKTLSRRITNKVQELLDTAWGEKGKIYISMSYDDSSWNKVEFYLAKDRGYQGARGWGYCDSEIYTTIHFPKGDKVDAETIREKALQVIQTNKKTQYKYKDAVRDYQRTTSKYFALVRNFQKECGELNPLLIDSQIYTTCSEFKQWEKERDENLGLSK